MSRGVGDTLPDGETAATRVQIPGLPSHPSRTDVIPLPTTGRGDVGNAVSLNRLLDMLEFDFVLKGTVRKLTALLGFHIARHLRSEVRNLCLVRPESGALCTSCVEHSYD